jgi:WD40 repeat protein
LLAVKDQFDKYPLRFIEIPSGKLLFEVATPGKSAWPSKLKFSPRDKFIAIHSAATYIIETSTKRVITIKSDLPNGSGCTSAAFSPDEKYYVMGSNDGKVFFYDISAEQYVTELTLDVSVSRIEGLSFTKMGNYLFVNSVDNFIQLWDLKTRKLAATLYPNVETTDWAVITPDGRFDASVNAQSYLFYVKGLDVFPLSALFEQFYTPDLLPRLLAGEVFPPVLIDLNNIKQAPVVKIQYQQSEQRNLEVADDIATYMNTTGMAEVTVNAFSKDDVVDEIRLFHNGKIVTLTTRNLIVADENSSKEATKKYTVNLLPGQNNLRALALNSQRTESTPDEISVIYSAKNVVPQKPNTGNNTSSTPVATVDKSATLYLVVVGINKYQNEKMSLNYALADATAFKDELEKDAKSIISNIKTYFVTDNTANKSGIITAFKQVQETAKPQDVFVFYYAGHGVIGKDKEFYLVPNDVSDLKNVQAELVQKGIPAKLLQQYAIDIPAQKQLFILDACQSAGAFNEMLSADGDQQKSIAVVSRSTGTHWMAASGAQQYANEFSQLGHGAFTYVLLEALKGSAAADKMITVNGLKNYLQQEVPELMKKYSGTLQYPASYGFGNDFPVEVIK